MDDKQASAKEWALLYSAVLCGYLPKQVDAIFIHAQDYFKDELLYRSAELYLDFDERPKIVINGLEQYENQENSGGYFEWRRILMWSDVKWQDIIKIPASYHTGEEAVEIVNLCKKQGWKKLVIVATPQHLPRCFLTVLGVLQNLTINTDVYCATVVNYDWQNEFEKHSILNDSAAGNGFAHFEDEFGRILKYRNSYLKGDLKITPVASVKLALDYLKNRSK